MESGAAARDRRCSESIAVGSEQVVEKCKTLREPPWSYGTLFENDRKALSHNNTQDMQIAYSNIAILKEPSSNWPIADLECRSSTQTGAVKLLKSRRSTECC